MSFSHHLTRTQLVESDLSQAFDFFSDAANLELITPPLLKFRILTPLPIQMLIGTRIDYALSLYGVPFRWRTRITEWQPGVRFVDEQESGPFAFWHHLHEFKEQPNGTLMHDRVEYALPLGPIGTFAHHLFVERTLGQIFEFRREAIGRLLTSSVMQEMPSRMTCCP